MSLPEPKSEGFTYGDYLKWPNDQRWELIEGQAYDMTPAPMTSHQKISMIFSQVLMNFFEGKPCTPFHAAVDVLLPYSDEDDEAVDTVVQPDLLVVCDPAKIGEKAIKGAPDLVIEILSPSTATRDLGEKMQLYEKHGVRCYAIVDPWSHTITLRELAEGGKFGHPQIFAVGDVMPIGIFPGLAIDLARVFG